VPFTRLFQSNDFFFLLDVFFFLQLHLKRLRLLTSQMQSCYILNYIYLA
jgi:hypothetical protein